MKSCLPPIIIFLACLSWYTSASPEPERIPLRLKREAKHEPEAKTAIFKPIFRPIRPVIRPIRPVIRPIRPIIRPIRPPRRPIFRPIRLIGSRFKREIMPESEADILLRSVRSADPKSVRFQHPVYYRPLRRPSPPIIQRAKRDASDTSGNKYLHEPNPLFPGEEDDGRPIH